MKSPAAALCSILALAGFGSATNVGSPVEKVVHLLEDMAEKLQHDQKHEEAIYDEYKCWCTGMTSKKGKAIEDAKTQLKELGGDIVKLSGKVATLSSEIDDDVKEIKETHEEAHEATEDHQKVVASFNALRAEMGQALQSLNQALKMLKTAPQFLQAKTVQSLSTETANTLRSAINAIPDKALGSLPPAKLSQLQRISAAVAQGKYDPSYGSIVTILEEMYNQFSGDLEKETETFSKASKDFEDELQIKYDRIKELQDSVDKKRAEKAEAAKEMAEKQQLYDDTEAQMKADIEFFEDAVEACKAKAAEWKERKELREEELAGVKKAIEILSSDEARELFGKAVNAEDRVQGSKFRKPIDFLQLGAAPAKMPAGQEKAFKVLKSIAKSSNSVALARIAATVRLASGGHFDAVMKAIDDVIKVLKEEQEDDDAKKKQCNEEYHDVAKTVADLKWKIERNIAKIDKLEDAIAKAEKELSATIKAIKEVEEQLEEMKKIRDEEKDAFEAAKKDDEDAIDLLRQAKTALQAYYKKHQINDAIALHIEEPKFDRGDAPPDATFSDKGKRAIQSKSITELLDNIVAGLQDEIEVQTKIEAEAVAYYEKAKKAAEEVKAELEEKRDNLKETIADSKKEKDDEETKKEANEADLKDEEEYKAKITPDCDFVLKNWQSRMNKRNTEMDGLVAAKDYLAGAMKDDTALVAQKSRLRLVAHH